MGRWEDKGDWFWPDFPFNWMGFCGRVPSPAIPVQQKVDRLLEALAFKMLQEVNGIPAGP